jgi:CheY-like chemotaxis protein
MGGSTQRKKRVLVVGDLPFERDALVRELLYLGYEVSQSRRGPTALTRVHHERPDLLILQYPVMVAADRTLTASVREEDALRHVRILNVAPEAPDQVVAEAAAAGVDANVKSADPKRVVAEVKQLIGPAVPP